MNKPFKIGNLSYSGNINIFKVKVVRTTINISNISVHIPTLRRINTENPVFK